MGDRRLGRGRFFALWLVLVVLQIAALYSLPMPLKAVAVVLLQLAKLPITIGRMTDLGRPPADAVFMVLIPLINVYGLFYRCVQPTPSPQVWEKRRARWSGRLGPFAALAGGARLAAKTAALGLPITVIYALIGALGARFAIGRMEWALTLEPEQVQLYSQAAWGTAAFLAIYTVLQYGKRQTVSRQSWLPSLLLVPTLLVAAALTVLSSGLGNEYGLLVVQVFGMAWWLAWASIGGAALVIGQILLGHAAVRGESVGAGELIGQITSRTADVSAAHGAKVHAVTVGLQVIVPGIFYALQLAFVDMIAVLEPEERSLSRSGKLTWGMRSTLLQLLFVWVLASTALQLGLTGLFQPDMSLRALLQAFLFDPRPIGVEVIVAGEIMWAITTWITEMALLLMYLERVAALRERQPAGPDVPSGVRAAPAP